MRDKHPSSARSLFSYITAALWLPAMAILEQQVKLRTLPTSNSLRCQQLLAAMEVQKKMKTIFVYDCKPSKFIGVKRHAGSCTV